MENKDQDQSFRYFNVRQLLYYTCIVREINIVKYLPKNIL
jgi:hypothetical protein